jgi:hypothetical protein
MARMRPNTEAMTSERDTATRESGHSGRSPSSGTSPFDRALKKRPQRSLAISSYLILCDVFYSPSCLAELQLRKRS